MVATTFAADIPLPATGIVAENGIAGNWLWWNAGLGSMLTVFFFARLWRRVYCPRVLGQWFDGIRFYAAASSPRRSRRTWAGLR